ADRAGEILEPLGPSESQRPVADRVERSIGGGLRTVGRSIGDYVGALPSRIARGTMEDLTELAGQVTQDIVGNSSVIEIVWRDQVEHDESTPYGNLADRIAEDTQSEIDLLGGIASDPHMWIDLNNLVSRAIDGGEIPNLDLASDDGLIPVISEVDRIVAAPLATLGATIDNVVPDRVADSDIDQDAVDDVESAPVSDRGIAEPDPTLISRIDSVIASYRNVHTETLNQRIGGMVELLRSLRWGPPLGIAIGGGVSAFAGMLLIVQAVVFSGLADKLGIYSMSGETRDTAWAIASLVVLVVLVTVGYVGFQSSGGWSKAWPPLVAAGLAASLGGIAAHAMTTFGSGVSTKEMWGAAATLAILVGAPVLSGTLWLQGRKWRTAGQMARVAYVAWLVYFGFIIVGSVVRPGGWWDDDHGNALIYMFLVTLLLLVLSIVATGYMEYRYRHRLRAVIDEIAWFEKEIVSAVHSRAATDEALEQFKAFAATWSYIVWNPAGRIRSTSPAMPGLAEMSVLKAGFLSFGLTERGEQELRNATRNEISKIGWLKDQYELAVAAFQSDDGVRMGATSRSRPDQDARPIAAVQEDRRAGLSARWRFAEAMVSSELDYALLDRFDELEPLAIYEEVLGDRRNLVMADQDSSPMGEFFLALRQGEDVEISASQLTIQGRMDTKSADRVLRSHVWWPEVNLPGVAVDAEDDECALITSRESVVVVAVRSDWAGPFVPGAVSSHVAPPTGSPDAFDEEDPMTPDV
ncbi:MAG: hypothetical protein M3132_11025, partial [Actinomycetia bacterium]|nr:hypothetical protein [Actinomycetes bacterium]